MTIIDVAKNLNLSTATISRAINGTGKIKDETKKKVLDYIKEVGYTPNAIAINLSKQKTRNIAILVPNITNSFFSNLIEEICKVFNEKKYNVMLYNTNESRDLEREAIRNIAAQRVNFVIAILVKSNYSNNPLKRLQDLGVNCMLLDRDVDNYTFNGIFLDNYSGSYEITTELLKEGHRDIGIITGDNSITSSNERLRGYKDAIEGYGLEINEDNIYIGKFNIETGENAVEYFKDKNITALYAVNNQIVLGVLKKKLEIDKELRLACFEKSEVLESLGIEILACKIPANTISEALLQSLEDGEIGKKYIKPILINSEVKN